MKLQSALDLKARWLDEMMPDMAEKMRHGKSTDAGLRAAGMRAKALGAAGDELLHGLAVGVTRKSKDGYAMALHVERRYMAESEVVKRMKQQARGELVLRVTGRAHAMASPRQQQRIRPLETGLSVGHFKVTAGTLGAFATRRGDRNGVHVLSNNHVLANENASRLGDAVLQPGSLDDGSAPKDTVAVLSARRRIFYTRPNRCDCALARLKLGVKHQGNVFPGIGKLKGIKAAEPRMKVFKIGRTTGMTHGVVADVELDGRYIEFERGDARFDGIIAIETTKKGQPFCDGGDSGSLIVSEDGYAIGLLFAGTDSGGAYDLGFTYANPIEEVLHALQASLL